MTNNVLKLMGAALFLYGTGGLIATTNGDVEESTQAASISQRAKNDALHAAVRGNQPVEVESQLRQGADVNAVMSDQYTYTPLHWAAYYGYTDIVTILLSHHANVNAIDKFGRTPLHKAAYEGNDETRLAGKKLKFRNDSCSQCIGDWAAVLCPHGWIDVGVDYMGESGSVRRDQWSTIVSLLLAHNADVNIRDLDKNTPLEMMGYKGKIPFSLLLAHANVNVRDHKYGKTPLHWCASIKYDKDEDAKRKYEDASFLLAHGADVNAESAADGGTPLHVSAEYGNVAFTSLLLANGANVNARDRYERMPLHLATRFRNDEHMSLLLASGADVNAK
ncbi:MAG: ankyrin repeat domain-containing protein, partial [Alphaproteobacteria bacterium]